MPRAALVNSPLVEVAYEVRFPGNFAVFAGLDRIQRALGDDFPNVLVPNVDPGDHLALKHYRFASADLLETVGVALNSFLFSTKRYTVFADFQRRIEPILGALRDVYRPQKFSRIGLRFTNLLPWQLGTVTNVHPWLALGIAVPAAISRPLVDYQGSSVFEFEENTRLRVTTGRAQHTRELIAGGRHQMIMDNFLLDLDCYREGDILEGQEVAFLPTAHRIIDGVFFDVLTAEARAQLEGRQ